MLDITKLKSSWTKYSAVQTIDTISSIETIESYKSRQIGIDEPIFRTFLGIENLSDPIPAYWERIQDYPGQKRLFGLMTAVFTHYQNIEEFIDCSTGDMRGLFVMKPGKQYTNLRSILVESGAAPNSYRRKDEVPYDLSPLFEKGEVGLLFKEVLFDRLKKIGWDPKSDFLFACRELNFHKALSLSWEQFTSWMNGESITESKLKIQLEGLRNYSEIRAYKVNQWLQEWDQINFSVEELREKPQPFFFMFKIDARLLKRLSDVHRRSSSNDRKAHDASLQRAHKVSRSEEIHNYIHGGFPWSTISKAQQEMDEFKELKMPGFLPTAIIANILGSGAERNGKVLAENDTIIINNQDDDFPLIEMPKGLFEESWDPELKPIEIIDGQHRLWAFDEDENLNGNYEIPVVAYYNLDRAWQAYLFYTINIKPVKINTSLGYDLYPLLRTQQWLESSKDGLLFYRENRAQEIVDALWTYNESPWKDRIKMTGEGRGNISQAAFIKALTSSYLKKSAQKTNRGVGGLFSDIIQKGTKYQVLNWNRTQQAAFLILVWDLILSNLNSLILNEEKVESAWVRALREYEDIEDVVDGMHPAFTSRNSFLSRDQGVRGISMFSNDVFYLIATSDKWNLNDLTWDEDLDDKTIHHESIDEAITNFRKHDLYIVMQDFASEIVKFDWRTPSADFSDAPQQRLQHLKYKGGSGYSEVWRDLVGLFVESENDELKRCATELSTYIKTTE